MFFIGSNQSPAKDCDDNFGQDLLVGEGVGGEGRQVEVEEPMQT